MPVITGGYTVDSGYCAMLDKSGMHVVMFNSMLVEAIKQKLAAIESAGTLSAAEIKLRDTIYSGSFPPSIISIPSQECERITQFFMLEPKWSRGYYMPSADIAVCLTNQWTNILKKYI